MNRILHKMMKRDDESPNIEIRNPKGLSTQIGIRVLIDSYNNEIRNPKIIR